MFNGRAEWWGTVQSRWQPAASHGDATSVILRVWQLLGPGHPCRDAVVLTGEVNETKMDREVSSDNIKSKCYIFLWCSF